MNTEFLRRIEDIYHAAREIHSDKRDEFLAAACGSDEELRRRVDALLRQDVSSGPLKDSVNWLVAGLLGSERPSRWKRGAMVGPYSILDKLGEGGMGEVFKATDTRLGRSVAIKTAHEEFIGRFRREAGAISALNHPNICTLYDIGPDYLVMEFVDGVALRGPMPVEKALAYAGQILDALNAAHRAGITHRDLKPGNILVTKQGIKLLDFGLAKRRGAAVSDRSETRTETAQGHIVGTFRYMSPEQLEGKEADPRSDIFSFGCVLYELLSGTRAFSGNSTAGVIAAIMEREPEPLRTTTSLDRVIRTCLAKDPEMRFQNAVDLKRDLLWAVEEQTPPKTPWHRLPWAIAAATLLALIMLLLSRFNSAPKTAAAETRVDIVTPPTPVGSALAISPDGQQVAFVAAGDGANSSNAPTGLWVRSLQSTSAHLLPGTAGAMNPFWAPDSKSIGFFAEKELRIVDVAGGQPRGLGTADPLIWEGSWSPAGIILYCSGGRMLRKSVAGSAPPTEMELGPGLSNVRAPRFLPDGRRFLFVSAGTEAAIWLGSLDGEKSRRIELLTSPGDSAAEYVPGGIGGENGWLVRVQQNTLIARHFEPGSGRISGDLVKLAEGVSVEPGTMTGAFSASASGTVAWRSGPGTRRQLTWVDRSGRNVEPFGTSGDPLLTFPELSRNGLQVAVTLGPLGHRDIWLQQPVRSSRFTLDPSDHRYAIWAPDGSRIVFGSNRNGKFDLYEKPADGSAVELLLLRTDADKAPNSWSPDGRFILYTTQANTVQQIPPQPSNGELMILPLTGDTKPWPFVNTRFDERQGMFSPDGKWVAYQSTQSGQFELYVRSFPGPGGELQVSIGGGSMPRWRADGREIYYVAPDGRLMAVPIAVSGGKLSPGTPRSLFPAHIGTALNKQQYDVGRDGRFLLITEQENVTEPIHLLLNGLVMGR